MRSKFDAFDVKLIAVIGQGKSLAHVIQGALGAEADALAGKDHWAQPTGWRLIDRRLQALRKRGRITFSSKAGWRVVG